MGLEYATDRLTSQNIAKTFSTLKHIARFVKIYVYPTARTRFVCNMMDFVSSTEIFILKLHLHSVS